VVDDNQDSANTLGQMLEIHGHQIRVVHDGLAAVAAAGEFRPRVVLLDIGMPELDGYEACRRIRSEAWGREMILIALTGWGQDEDRRRTAAAGFDQHLVKPVDSQALLKVLAEVASSA
jgi:CheY-like chemotaxis protein